MAGEAVGFLTRKGLPYMANKSVEMAARYYASEALRNKNLQKKAITYGLQKLTPMVQKVGSEALDQLSTKIRPNKNYKTDRKDLDGGSIQLSEKVNDILTDPQKYKKYQQDLAKYAWQQAKIYGYWGTLGQFLTALGLAEFVPMKGTTNKIKSSTNYEGNPRISTWDLVLLIKPKRRELLVLQKEVLLVHHMWHVDKKKGIELSKDPGLWKTPSKEEIADMKQRVAALKRSYEAVKNLGFKGSYTTFVKKIGAVHKPAYTFPGFGGGISKLVNYQNLRVDGHCQLRA